MSTGYNPKPLTDPPKSSNPKKKNPSKSFWNGIFCGRVKNSSTDDNNTFMSAGSFYIPRDNPLKPKGEDANFVLLPKAFGIADGVEGLAKEGIDSGEYSRFLMSNTETAIKKQKTNQPLNPRKALIEGFYKTNVKGASTACIVTVHGDKLHAVNVGDSGFVHIRGGKIIYKSPFQEHGFNVPYQLGKGLDHDLNLAEEIRRDLEGEDVIVAGTDGLFDNVHDEELEEMVRKGQENHESPGFLAFKIAEFALGKALSESALTPFAVECRKAGINPERIGGKIDDITVVVAYIHQLVPHVKE